MTKTTQEIAQEARERIKDEAFHKTETGHSLDLTQTRQIIIDALTSYTEELKKKIEGKKRETKFKDSMGRPYDSDKNKAYNQAIEDITKELNHQ